MPTLGGQEELNIPLPLPCPPPTVNRGHTATVVKTGLQGPNISSFSLFGCSAARGLELPPLQSESDPLSPSTPALHQAAIISLFAALRLPRSSPASS